MSKKQKSLEDLEEHFFQAFGTAKASPKTLPRKQTVTEGGSPHKDAKVADEVASVRDHEDLETAEPLSRVLMVEIAEDGMTASLAMRELRCVAATEQGILELLEEHGVVFGIDYAAVKNAASLLSGQGGWSGKLVVARGIRGQKEEIFTVSFLDGASLDDLGYDGWYIENNFISFKGLKSLFASRTAKEFNENARAVKAFTVTAGEDLLGLGKNRLFREPGKTVCGRDHVPEKECIKAGENIGATESGDHFSSMIFGYFCLEDLTVSVIPPLWISDDRMIACYVHLSEAGRPRHPSPDHLRSTLLREKVDERCIKEDAIATLCGKLSQGLPVPLLTPIATGFKPITGKDAVFTFLLEQGIKAGTLREDGSIDLRERAAVQSVEAGTLIARKQVASKGTPGMDIHGKVINTTDGKEIAVSVAKGVRLENKGNEILYHADKSGNVSCRNNCLTISEEFKLNGDVDYSTGNIEAKSDIYISGSVRPGFSVKSSGNIRIDGSVEEGATIIAEGNVTVKMGILGETTEITSKGDLHAGFLQDAKIVVKGDIVVANYIFNSTVRAGGSVTVLRAMGQKGGKIVGGIVCATKAVNVATIGSPTNRSTVVALQGDPELMREAGAIAASLQKVSDNIMKLLRTLNLSDIDFNKIKLILAQAGGAQREHYVRVLSALKKLIQGQRELKEEEKRIKMEISRLLHAASIRVTNELYLGNEIRIGEKKFVAPEDMGLVTFQLQDDRIVY